MKEDNRPEKNVLVSYRFFLRTVKCRRAFGIFLLAGHFFMLPGVHEKITTADTGQFVTFRLTNGKSYVNYKGTINRYIEGDDDNKYLAVFFNQRSMHELV